MNTIISMLLLAALLVAGPAESAAPEPTVASGKIVRLADFPSKLVPPRNVDIWLPDGYPERGPYSVLYMHDGAGLYDAKLMWNHQEWKVDETASALMAAGKVRPFIVVGVWNSVAERQSEYMPQKPLEAAPEEARKKLLEGKFADGRALYSGPVRSDAYLRFLVEELKPYVDQHYKVRTGPEDTVVMGSSMGGMISIYAICEYPNVFGATGALSTHWPGGMTPNDGPIPQAMREYLRKHLPDPRTHRIWFDHGTATLDAMYPELQRKVDAVMRDKGYDATSWQTRVFENAEHSENAWAERLAIPLEFLLPPRKSGP